MELNKKMLKKEDFKNPIDWVIYQVNGKKNNTTNIRINENYTLSEAKYPLKFYKTRSEGRYSVIYGKNHLCNCSYEGRRKVQDYFDEHFNGKNLNQVTLELKKEHNQVIKTRKRGRKPKSYKRNHLRFQPRKNGRLKVAVSDKGKTHTICNCYNYQIEQVKKDFENIKTNHSLDEIKEMMKNKYNIKDTPKEIVKPKRKGKSNRGYSENKVLFELRETGRVQVRVSDKGKTHTICSCNPNQKEQVSSRYDELKTEHDLDYIKKTMKEEFNLRVNGRVNGKYNSNDNVKHQISIREDGVVFKDGQYVCVNEQLYDIISKLL